MATWIERAQFAVARPKDALSTLSLRLSAAVPGSARLLRWLSDEQTGWFIEMQQCLFDRKFGEAARAYRNAVALNPEHSTVYNIGYHLSTTEGEGLTSGFYSALIDQIETPELQAMFRHLAGAPALFQPSRLWLYMMTFNALQIETGGIENFKRTANKNYFTWTADRDVAEQFAAVNGSPSMVSGMELYREYVHLLYGFAKERDSLNLLENLSEPKIGNPICFEHNGVTISQDMCNTALELNTIIPKAGLTRDSAFTVYELGAGCGRIGFGLVKCFPRARYVVIDIPAALYVSQWYLGNAFPSEPIFRFREFSEYQDIRSEFEDSRLAFLTPDQAGELPPRSCDIFVNICSLQEMSRGHVDYWFAEVERLCSGIFYYKQSFKHFNPMDKFSLNKEDYPVNRSWRSVLDRACPTFPSLFELIYRI